ncbi:endolytic transglycosylase MltG [Virgibacillus litoralis]|uniref:Flap endonuclease-1-like 5' DNA nuclease n=1 Tax=Virgibacillus litoralis TaxID=578221 RepID=A0ABS4HIZ4_9BACI|nr:endolytic transglycosylase MltG [Virgibacillus litoralis]MBP1950900.1 putative flap endonuclease-1-like 5' DNA nuclease [Virgibacillus litoralis]
MKQPIRSFALGLLSAGILLLIMSYFTDNPQNKNVNMSTDEMIKSVEAEGYRVLTESEYISVSVKSEENENTGENDNSETQPKEEQKNSTSNESQESETEETNDEEKNDPSTDENSKVSYTLTVKSGMAPSTISSTLAENGIIKDRDEFTQYMEEQGYTTKVQLGDFELTSNMSHYEIAEEITN